MEVSSDNATPAFDKVWLSRVTIGFVVCCLVLAAYLVTRHPRVYLALEFASSAPSVAQLYYNTGAGYNEKDSRRVSTSSDSLRSFQKLVFELPPSKILNLRFDPMEIAGQCVIRDITIRNRVQILLRIPPASVVPFHQIQSRTRQNGEVTLSTTPDANDAGVLLELSKPFDYKQVIDQEKSLVFLAGSAVLLGLAVLIYLGRDWLERIGRRTGHRIRRVDEFFETIAQRLSASEFIQFDSYAIWFYSFCIAGLFLSSVADLNGSSIGMYNAVGQGAPETILLGAPRAVRSDEWVYHTPDILNECLRLRKDRFEVENTQRGGHDVALMDNVPVWHFSTIFRPQFWSFFVLPVDYAYAVYWQCKAFLLLFGVFTWLLLITRSSFWSITGSLWLFFSPFTQWTYSWASDLPEMVGLVCLTMVLFCFLTVGRKPFALVVAALATATCAIDFALCAYVPHLLPLAWLSVFFIVAWCVSERKSIFRREYALRRIAAIVAVAVLVGFTGWAVYMDLREAITAMMNTVYPGNRVFAGATLSLQELTSHFMEWTETEVHFPPALGNISEGSGFLWLAPVTLFFMSRLTLTRLQKYMVSFLWCLSILMLIWLLFPVPAQVGRIFGMDRTGLSRCFPALGLANVAIVMLGMAAFQRGAYKARGGLRNARDSVYCLAGLILLFFVILYLTDELIGNYFSLPVVLSAAAFAGVLALLMLQRRRWAFALTLVVPQALVFGAVNPIEHGLGVVLSSPTYKLVQANRNLLNGKWLVFSDSIVRSGFLAATGCDVYTGMHFLPDIDHFPLFASKGLEMRTLNNSIYLTAHPISARSKTSLERPQFAVIRWNVDPLDPILKQLGIKYLAFDQKPPQDVASHLIPLTKHEVDDLWLYKLP